MKSLEESKRDAQKLLDEEDGLSEWEIDFAESIMEQLEGGQSLSIAQRHKLDEILTRLGL